MAAGGDSTDLKLQEIAMRLGNVETAQARHISRNEQQHSTIEREVLKIDTMLRGNGTPGLNERVRDLERYVSEVKQIKKWVIAAVVGALVNAAFLWLDKLR